ncbi:pH-response regulator protein palA/rim20, partial [Rhizoclosmatium hyalinum]
QLTQTLSPESQFQATPTSLVSDLETLNTLRRRVFSGDGSEVEVVLTYAAHIGRLSVLAPRGPVAFTWSSWASSKSEGGGSVASGSVASVASFAVAFERANALCVAAAVAANSADLNWPKDAAKRLCTAAAAFAEAANTLDAALKSGAASQADTRDAPLCQALSACALAMAQEAFVTKAVLDSLSSATIAKLATAAANLFESASASLSPLATSNPSLASWPPFLAVKRAHLAAIADFNLAKQAAASCEIGKYGTEIGYLKRAQVALTKADPDLLPQTSILSSWIKPSTPDSGSSAALPASLKQELRNLYDQITQILIPAEKDNDKIYMEIVPSLENLPVPSPAVMVKPDFPSLTPPNITPLFQNILPPHLRSLHAKYTTSLAAHLAPILTTDLPTATSTCKSTLASLNLPGSLLSLSKSTTQFLQDLRGAHPQGFSAKALNHQTNTLQTLRATCFQTLSSAVQSLDQESRDDAEMRTSFGPHKWTRVDSETLTRGLREAATKYQEKLDAARSSDDVIFQK